MNRNYPYQVAVVGLLLGFFALASTASAQAAPKALRGQIITNSRDINVPTSAAKFVKKMRRQDRKMFKRDESGKWVIYFVASFKCPGASDGGAVP